MVQSVWLNTVNMIIMELICKEKIKIRRWLEGIKRSRRGLLMGFQDGQHERKGFPFPGIEPRSATLLEESLLSELPGKQLTEYLYGLCLMHSKKKGASTIRIGFYKWIIKINISREIKITWNWAKWCIWFSVLLKTCKIIIMK